MARFSKNVMGFVGNLKRGAHFRQRIVWIRQAESLRCNKHIS